MTIDLDKYTTAQEAAIARRVVAKALSMNWRVSVYDGEAWTVKRSQDQDVILAALASTDMDTLRFRSDNDARIGTVDLIWGNGCDLVSDYSDNPIMNAFLAEFMVED